MSRRPLAQVLIPPVALAAVAVAGAACGSERRAAAPPPPLDAAAPPPSPVATTPPPPPIPEFPDGTRSLRLKRTMPVRLEPADEAKRIGTIAQDTRVSWTKLSRGKGCKQPWVQIVPRGWVCSDFVEPTTRVPVGVELPRLDREEVVPGTYGRITGDGASTYALPPPPGKDKNGKKKDARGDKKKGKPAPPPPDAGVPDAATELAGPVTSPDQLDAEPAAPEVPDPMLTGHPLLGSVTVRKYGEIAFGDVVYWKVSRGNEYVRKKSIYEHKPSTYQGTRLGDDTGLSLPLAFVWPRSKSATKVATHRKSRGGGTVRQVPSRTALGVVETFEVDGKPVAYRVGDAEWIDAAQVRLVTAAEPPPLVGEHERWFDVDLDTQVLVAYEGRLPVYATMVSTGKKDTPTETGVFRMWKKISETDMKGLSGEDPYSVATVPWTQFFSPERGLALHAAYWHDSFGTQKSHGCVNLAPQDARWLYFWSEPVVPAGWTMTAGVVEAPGSIVRVHSKDDPDPPFKGYAKTVQAARAGGGEP
ncbi:MAG: L,D-transpeptidase [Kofleriaceae bacterium]|nr:L,D-transpeptidase [Kofleriaceae bacterium]MCB9574924.1 L,D-transpeptidase [Kofleriaceae bacterium]